MDRATHYRFVNDVEGLDADAPIPYVVNAAPRAEVVVAPEPAPTEEHDIITLLDLVDKIVVSAVSARRQAFVAPATARTLLVQSLSDALDRLQP